MYSVNLFVEDFGHETFLDTLVRRFANHYDIPIEIRSGSALGGYGRMIRELKKYISDLQRSKQHLPDLIIAATDGNCKGYLQRQAPESTASQISGVGTSRARRTTHTPRKPHSLRPPG